MKKKPSSNNRGRKIFQLVLDEMKQIGIKQLGGKDYTIYLNTCNPELVSYYKSFGFERIKGDEVEKYPNMFLKVE